MEGAMILMALLALQAAPAAGATRFDPDTPEGRAESRLTPDVTRRWEQEAPAMCAAASSPAECRPAYLSARYSEAAMEVCRDVAGLEFRYAHGTTTTTYAQHAIRRTCRSSIDYCRSAWLNYDRINFAGRPSRSDPRRLTHFGLFLNETCGAEAGVDAPF
jgi:hypothetical protein